MPRGNASVTKCHYKGKDEDFIVFVESADDVEKWKNDSSIPLAQVVSGFKIMITHKQGAQGQLDGASKSQIENEFGSSDEDEAIKQILTKGTLQVSENSERSGDTNITKGGTIGHATGNR
ncbi:uncharacterized protein HMPREF1541_01055 [Cyphellophora europaea CBS 101466]|uniref:Ribosome maturation protein SDO1/SBDS N-terminal domain-containing protein n=1 Tax=Cyphellophora europaea (strain CBS 101466) TaxID=1220924 RepID=W2SDT2_CYPE1|nr:uncharacterized protein HMPREF1541_01055 [Cyphellophora europaea CBS 101466]ETN46866.1 hypothetical protein HMPREF1541_01055 [Cyphellophora europaea CBS 101466]